jgi:hypothetical protein
MNRSDWDWAPGKKSSRILSNGIQIFNRLKRLALARTVNRLQLLLKLTMPCLLFAETETPGKGFDKIWSLRFLVDNRLSAIVNDSVHWTLAVEGQAWEN